MLASNCEDFSALRFPLYASLKLDGDCPKSPPQKPIRLRSEEDDELAETMEVEE